jgi:hypothetical protein
MFDFSALKTTGMEIVFTKKNGEERTMRCTTNLKVVPSNQHPNGNGYASSSNVKKVYDIDKQDWRSFRVDSVKSAKAL